MELIGITPQQLVEITAFVQKHHSFGYVVEADRYEGHEGYCIKYIDACYDTRQGDYWGISFRGFGKMTFNTNAIRFGADNSGIPYKSLFDWVMAFLKYEWQPVEKMHDFMWRKEEGPLINKFPNGIIEKEWSDLDMINAYCADLNDGITAEDMIDATKWLVDYRNKQSQTRPAQ